MTMIDTFLNIDVDKSGVKWIFKFSVETFPRVLMPKDALRFLVRSDHVSKTSMEVNFS